MTEPDPRRAITEHRDNIRAEPRPTPVANIVDPGGDDADLFRLYRWEWVVGYTALAPVVEPFSSLDEMARAYFDDRYAGRIPLYEVRMRHDGTGEDAMLTMELRLPVLKGEFKYAHLAHGFAMEQGWNDFHVVARNSREDHNLRSYGTKKLSPA